MDSGGQCVTITGITVVLWLSADSLVSTQNVRVSSTTMLQFYVFMYIM